MPISKASSNAVAPAAKGDLVVGNATNDSGILSVGTANQVLTVDSATATGLKWATPATPSTTKSYSLLSTTNLSGSATITVSGISGVDDILVILDNVGTASTDEMVRIRLNTNTTYDYSYFGNSVYPAASVVAANVSNFNSNNENAISVFARSSNSGSVGGGAVRISGCNSSGFKVFTSTGGASALGGSTQRIINVQGVWKRTETITSIAVFNDYARNFNGGTVSVYVAA